MDEPRSADRQPRLRVEMLGPWNKTDARRAILALMSVMSTLILINALTHHQQSRAARVMSFVFPAYWVVAGPLIAKYGHNHSDPAYAILPVVGCSTLTVMDVLNRDASSASQVFFVLMALYGGSQLKPLGAAFVTIGGILNDSVVVFTILPFNDALRDWCSTTVIFTTVTLLLVRGATAQQRLTEILSQQAAVDSLTGLVNRRVLEEAATSAIVSANGTDGTALILLDVDNFKHINDTYGHPVGDLALAHIAEVISRNTRKDSVVSRLGGDEMAVLMPHCSYDVAHRRATEIVQAIRAAPVLSEGSGIEVQLSVSAGVAHVPTHADSLTGLYEAADSGLYEAKRQGRDQVGRATVPPRTGGPAEAAVKRSDSSVVGVTPGN